MTRSRSQILLASLCATTTLLAPITPHLQRLAHAASPAPVASDPRMWPVTDGAVDLGYWKPEARTAFFACTGQQSSWDTVAQAARIRDCTRQIRETQGTPCQATTAPLCQDVGFHQSWCGRLEFAELGARPDWQCRAALGTAVSSFSNRLDFQEKTVLLPERVSRPGGTTEHVLERRTARSGEPVSYTVGTNGVTVRSDRYNERFGPPPAPGSDPGGPVLVPQFGPRAPSLHPDESRKRTAWRENGPAITSCEEYAYEKTQDFSLLEDWARGRRRNPRAIYDAVVNGRTGVPAFVGANNQVAIKDSIGRVLPLPGRLPDSPKVHGFGFPLPIPARPDFNDPRATRQWMLWLAAKRNPITYINFMLRSDGQPMDERYFMPWDTSQLHVVNLPLHRELANRLTEFIDEELEAGVALADEAWELVQRYDAVLRERNALPASAPRRAELDEQATALRAELEAVVEKGENLGCTTGSPTPCDWAPSAFAEPMFAYYRGVRSDIQRTCEERYGGGTFDEAALEAKAFFDPTPVFPGRSNAAKLAEARRLRATYMARSYLGRPDLFERIDADTREYRRAILRLALPPGASADGAFRGSGAFEHTLGKPGMFGVTMKMDGAMGLASKPVHKGGGPLDPPPAGSPECEDGPFYEGTLAADLSLFLGSFPLANFVNAMDKREWEDDEGGLPAHGSEESGYELGVSGEFKGEALVDVPCKTDDGVETSCDGAQIDASVRFGFDQVFFRLQTYIQAGPVTIALGGGLSGHAAITLGVSARHEIITMTPTSRPVMDCEEQYRDTTTVTFLPDLGIDGFVSAGVGIGPISVGVKGTMSIVNGSMPIEYSDSFSTMTGLRETDWNIQLALSFLSGKISLVLEAFTFTLLELVLIEWGGPVFRHKVAGSKDVQDVCWLSSLRAVTEAAPEKFAGCPCLLGEC